jgi:hypothetical protein
VVRTRLNAADNPLHPPQLKRGVTQPIFMHSGEPKDHEIFALNDSEELEMRFLDSFTPSRAWSEPKGWGRRSIAI